MIRALELTKKFHFSFETISCWNVFHFAAAFERGFKWPARGMFLRTHLSRFSKFRVEGLVCAFLEFCLT